MVVRLTVLRRPRRNALLVELVELDDQERDVDVDRPRPEGCWTTRHRPALPHDHRLRLILLGPPSFPSPKSRAQALPAPARPGPFVRREGFFHEFHSGTGTGPFRVPVPCARRPTPPPWHGGQLAPRRLSPTHLPGCRVVRRLLCCQLPTSMTIDRGGSADFSPACASCSHPARRLASGFRSCSHSTAPRRRPSSPTSRRTPRPCGVHHRSVSQE